MKTEESFSSNFPLSLSLFYNPMPSPHHFNASFSRLPASHMPHGPASANQGLAISAVMSFPFSL
jgi:hypothetical protein